MKFVNRVWIGRRRVTANTGTCIGDPEPARGAIRARKLAAPLAATEAMGAALNQSSPSTTRKNEIMNALTRWNPFSELDELQDRLSTFFGRAPVRRQNGEQESLTVAEWAPLVDLTEDDKEYLI